MVVKAHDSFMQKIIDDNSALTGSIHLSAARPLTPLLQRFHDMHPQITIGMQVHKGAVDMATITCRQHFPGLCNMSRGRNVYLPLASPLEIQKHGMPTDPVSLRLHAGLLYSDPTRKETEMLYQDDKAEPVTYASSIRSTDVLTIRNALLEGMRVAVDMPLVQIHEDLLKGRLAAILPV